MTRVAVALALLVVAAYAPGSPAQETDLASVSAAATVSWANARYTQSYLESMRINPGRLS